MAELTLVSQIRQRHIAARWQAENVSCPSTSLMIGKGINYNLFLGTLIPRNKFTANEGTLGLLRGSASSWDFLRSNSISRVECLSSYCTLFSSHRHHKPSSFPCNFRHYARSFYAKYKCEKIGYGFFLMSASCLCFESVSHDFRCLNLSGSVM